MEDDWGVLAQEDLEGVVEDQIAQIETLEQVYEEAQATYDPQEEY